VETPWLTPKEAANYCKISLSLFNQIRRKIPIKIGGTMRRPRFHKDELDYWMGNMFKTERETEIERNKEIDIKNQILEENSKLEIYPIKIKEKKHKVKPLL
jgi:hypothetical protein